MSRPSTTDEAETLSASSTVEIGQSKLLEFLGFLIPVRSGASNISRLGLQRLLLLRSFITVASVFGLFIFQSNSDLEIPIDLIISLVGAVLISVLLGYWRLKSSPVFSNRELFCHLLIDVVFLTILLLNTGGASNPLISYLLVLLAVAATLLPSRFVNSFAIGSILIYTSFLLLDLSSEHDLTAGSEAAMASQESVSQLHLIGMWVIFVVSAILITVFITRMTIAIQIRELNLAKARETEMRNEQLVAIGTLAAGTAHALGTPLSTMAVLLTDLDKLDSEQLKKSDIKEDISLLKEQVTRCKDSLTQLIRYYHKDNSEQEETISLQDFAHDIQDYIINIHPAARVSFSINTDGDRNLSSDLSVKHAVINLIENAIKAAANRVEVNFRILEDGALPYEQLEISINDDGPGIPQEVMENLGEPFISTRKESMGLGIFLANAAIQRLDGSIELFNLKIGGAQTIIKLPLPAVHAKS